MLPWVSEGQKSSLGVSAIHNESQWYEWTVTYLLLFHLDFSTQKPQTPTLEVTQQTVAKEKKWILQFEFREQPNYTPERHSDSEIFWYDVDQWNPHFYCFHIQFLSFFLIGRCSFKCWMFVYDRINGLDETSDISCSSFNDVSSMEI